MGPANAQNSFHPHQSSDGGFSFPFFWLCVDLGSVSIFLLSGLSNAPNGLDDLGRPFLGLGFGGFFIFCLLRQAKKRFALCLIVLGFVSSPIRQPLSDNASD